MRFRHRSIGLALLALVALFACSPPGLDESDEGAGQNDAGNGGMGGSGGTAGNPDRKPCGASEAGCDPLATCAVEGDARTCGPCPAGYNDVNGDGTSCVDIDECASNNGNCGDPARFSCSNNAGKAPTCGDLDECAADNGRCGEAAHFTCQNNQGAPPLCGDVDECAGAHVCTGDYECQNLVPYYRCRGQFADWAPANSPSTLADNGNGTVTDSRNGLVWQRAVTPNTYTWANAKAYCTNLSLVGAYWRLPSKSELESIVDFSVANPSIDTSVFPSTPNEAFWSSSSYVVMVGNAWRVFFSGGASGFRSTSELNYVRCVSGGAATTPSTGTGGTPPGRYQTDTNGTAFDAATQLTWQRVISPNAFFQSGAMSYCGGLSDAGGGWRLPTISELLTLVDPTQFSASIDKTTFTSTPAESFWSASVYAEGGGSWFVGFLDGVSFLEADTTMKRVRCVR